MNVKRGFLFLLFVLIISVGTAFAQRTITFYAVPGSLIDASPGHAFIELSGYGVCGFYPQISGAPTSTGVMRNDSNRIPNATVRRSFSITENQWIRARFIIDGWIENTPRWTIGVRDCINFTYEVADSIGLSHHSYLPNMTVWPTSAVDSIGR